ncbi:hypothetical protein EJ04DRAFT_393431, partial [Polyplosphaeria fusca]
IILLGPKRVGKSSLMEDFTGATGHATTETIQLETATIDERQYVIIDTPGFDIENGKKTFYMIHSCIQELRDQVHNWGVLYVASAKLGSSIESIDRQLLQFIDDFCGQGFAPNITLVVTHWNWNHDREKNKMMKHMETRIKFWESFLNNGAQLFHHGRTDRSGHEMIDFRCWYEERAELAQCARNMIARHYGDTEARTPLYVQELRQGIATQHTSAGFFIDPPT